MGDNEDVNDADPAAGTVADRAHILVDADACPVKDEVYRVAGRMSVPVTLVANNGFRTPRLQLSDGRPLVRVEIVPGTFDAADDRIAELAALLAGRGTRTVVVTADVPLADRAVKAGAVALKPNGDEWDAANVSAALATRNAMEELRGGMAGMTGALGGPAPFGKADRSRFLQALDRVLGRR